MDIESKIKYCKMEDIINIKKNDKSCDVNYFFNNIKKIISNDEVIIKFKKNTKRTKDTILKWLQHNNHQITYQSSISNKWKVGIPSSFIRGRKGNIWIDLNMDDGQNIRVFLYLKTKTNKLFKSFPDKKYLFIVRNLDIKLDILYEGCNTGLLLNITRVNNICRLNKPLFTGESYNKEYQSIKKSKNPFI